MKRLLLGLPLVLAGCGSAVGLRPAPGAELPRAPYGAAERPTAAELVTPTPQQRPQRSDELLKSSEERRSDDFDLPPDGSGTAVDPVANTSGSGG